VRLDVGNLIHRVDVHACNMRMLAEALRYEFNACGAAPPSDWDDQCFYVVVSWRKVRRWCACH
jgi:hypothetical protein